MPGVDAPSLIGTGTESLVDNAKRLGLTWTMSLATVSSVEGPTVLVKVDGDTEDISVASMIGPVTFGQRVYVLTVPPGGNFIVGYATPFPMPNTAFGRFTAPVVALGPGGGFVNVAGVTINITKLLAQTRLRIEVGGTFFTSLASAGVFFAVLVNGVATEIAKIAADSNAVQHKAFNGVIYLSNLPAGVFSIQVQWRVAGVGNGQLNTDDFIFIDAMETGG